jgi:hypothetical protein
MDRLSAHHMSIITKQVTLMMDNGEISKRCHDYLCNFKLRTSWFYMLPKIHKGISPPPGRPIISGNGSPTERISHFVDFFLQDIAKLGKSYVKDTAHFLKIIQDLNSVPDKTILVALDVKSPYTNIPNHYTPIYQIN